MAQQVRWPRHGAVRIGRHYRLLGSAGIGLALAAVALLAGPVQAQAPNAERVTGANFRQAHRYSSDFLKQYLYSTSVAPIWVGKTDAFVYEYRTSKGKQWYRVNPREAVKTTLFDRTRLASQLSEQVRKPLDPLQLPLARLSMSDDGMKLTFVTDQLQFEYDLHAETLKKLGKAPPLQTGPGGMSPEQQEKMRQILGEERFREFLEKQKDQQQKKEKGDDGAHEDESFCDDEMRLIDELLAEFAQEPQVKGGGRFGGMTGPTDRVVSPDKKWYVYAMNHNLYLAEVGKDAEAVQLSKDSTGDEYTFNAGPGFGGLGGGGQVRDEVRDKKDAAKDKDKKIRPQVTWSKDSKAFYATRTDNRNVKELFLVNSLANPRPSLLKYKYPMPGEEAVRKTELFVYSAAKKQLTRVERKWKDESYSDLHWGKQSDELRLVRRDRFFRNAEFCAINTQTAACNCMIPEGFENSSLVTLPVRYLDDSDEMIWWSERTGWGHFYLYDRAGKLKNPITHGEFRASAIVAVDPKNRVLYFKANGREPGENPYFNHLYSVHLDGGNLTLLDPGNANHESVLSPTRRYVVDNCSKFDQAPASVLRDARGSKVMDLEAADLSKLTEIGWKMPETFCVKAADGVTDLCGHLWKPFDFDAKRKYPVIAHVYPGPQTESMQHQFTPTASQQQLAQLGFLVIQVGNRGGTPLRSKAYQSYSYSNLRDYGLADKKTAIEQLAARHPWVDVERVGIYGHSGGGFMSAAALLVKPYNEFFKVAVSSAGNHDNNVYNNAWAERYHGMKEVSAKQEEAKKDAADSATRKGFFKGKSRTPPDPEDGDEDPAQDEAKKDVKEAGAKEEKKLDKKDDKTTATKDVKKDDKATAVKDVKKDDKAIAVKDVKKDDKTAKEEKKEEKAAAGKDAKKDEKKDDKVATEEKKDDKAKEDLRYEIKVPTNAELAGNLKGRLLLVHGDMDNNVHPAGTIRLVDALIKANKRFDLLILPGKAHGFADYQPYFTQRMWEYFTEHLLEDRPVGVDLYDRGGRK